MLWRRKTEMIQEHYPLIDNLITEAKKTFLKSPAHVNTFIEMCANISLPPQLLTTQCGTSLSAVTYYKANFDFVKHIIVSLKADAQSVTKCIKIDVNFTDLTFICHYSGYISSVIEQLETHNLLLIKSSTLYQTTIE